MVGVVNIIRFQPKGRLQTAGWAVWHVSVALLLSQAKQERAITISIIDYIPAVFRLKVVMDNVCNETKET